MNDLVAFSEITTSLIHTCVTKDGTRYVRLAESNWAQWMGESLEILQDKEEINALESAYRIEGCHFR